MLINLRKSLFTNLSECTVGKNNGYAFDGGLGQHQQLGCKKRIFLNTCDITHKKSLTVYTCILQGSSIKLLLLKKLRSQFSSEFHSDLSKALSLPYL